MALPLIGSAALPAGPVTHGSLTTSAGVEVAFRENRLLAFFPPGAQTALAPLAEVVCLKPGAQLSDAGEPTTHAYFPLAGTVLSRQVILRDGNTISVGLITSRTASGARATLGLTAMPWHVIARTEGRAVAIEMCAIRAEADRLPEMKNLLIRHTQEIAQEAARVTACVAFHQAERRCATLLLRLDDALGGTGRIPLVHESLSELLGIRRPTLTVSLNELRRAGLLETHRSAVVIVDPDALRAQACECYEAFRLLDLHL